MTKNYKTVVSKLTRILNFDSGYSGKYYWKCDSEKPTMHSTDFSSEIEVICDGAFLNVKQELSIFLPKKIKAIGADAFGPTVTSITFKSEPPEFDDNAFSKASGLKSIYVPDEHADAFRSVLKGIGMDAKVTTKKEEIEARRIEAEKKKEMQLRELEEKRKEKERLIAEQKRKEEEKQAALLKQRLDARKACRIRVHLRFNEKKYYSDTQYHLFNNTVYWIESVSWIYPLVICRNNSLLEIEFIPVDGSEPWSLRLAPSEDCVLGRIYEDYIHEEDSYEKKSFERMKLDKPNESNDSFARTIHYQKGFPQEHYTETILKCRKTKKRPANLQWDDAAYDAWYKVDVCEMVGENDEIILEYSPIKVDVGAKFERDNIKFVSIDDEYFYPWEKEIYGFMTSAYDISAENEEIRTRKKEPRDFAKFMDDLTDDIDRRLSGIKKRSPYTEISSYDHALTILDICVYDDTIATLEKVELKIDGDHKLIHKSFENDRYEANTLREPYLYDPEQPTK